MAENKYLDSEGVKYLWDKAAGIYVKQEAGKGLSEENYSAAEKDKLAGLENYELPFASGDSLGGIKIGDGLHIDENGVVKTVYNPEMPVEWEDIQDVPTTLEGYGITDAATKEELEEVREAVSKVYKYKGSVPTVADLDNIQNPQNGDVYDVEETGTNYAWNEEEARWDNLGQLLDIESISNYELDIITGSASSEAALRELMSEGGEVELAQNIALTEPLVITNNTELDLNGFNLSGNVSGYALVANGATLTLKGGSVTVNKRVAQAENGGQVIVEDGVYQSGDVAFSAIGEGSKVVLNDGQITAVEGGIGAFDQGEIEINGGSIVGTDNFPVFTNGTAGRGGNKITINGGEFEGNITSAGYESCCVYVANNDTVEINGGRFVSTDGCGILMRAGNVVINDCEIIAGKKDTDSHSPGYVGDKKKIMSATAVIYDEASNYPGKAGMSLEINGGTFVGADLALEVLSNETTPNVTVNGGEFTPAL